MMDIEYEEPNNYYDSETIKKEHISEHSSYR